MSDWFERFGFAPVADRLLTGAYPLDADDVAALVDAGVDVVYNLCEECEYEEGQRDAVRAALRAAGIPERGLAMVDYGSLQPEGLERAVGEVLGELEDGRTVYLHCRAGWQRSAGVAAAVIALRESLSLSQALEALRQRKPTSEPLPAQRADLIAWWRSR